MRRTPLAGLLLAGSLFTACAAPSARELARPAARHALADDLVATLDRQGHYFSTDERGAFAARLRRAANESSNAASYYDQVAAALSDLGEGHTGLIGSAEVPFAATVPPITILEVAGELIVAGVAPGIEGGGLRPGDRILAVDEQPATTVLAAQHRHASGSTAHGRRARAVENLLAGPTRAVARVIVAGLDGRRRQCFCLRFLIDGEGPEAGESRFRAGFLSRKVRSGALSRGAAFLTLPEFSPATYDDFEEALRDLRSFPVLVLDLRGNPGGRIRTLQRIAGLFLAGETKLLELHRGKRRAPVYAKRGPFVYGGSLRIVMDAQTGSAAELLAAALRDNGRARLFGTTTAGSTRARKSSVLPGDVLFHYAADTEFARRDGSRVEGVGVTPDVVHSVTRGELGRGAYGAVPDDATLRAAAGLAAGRN